MLLPWAQQMGEIIHDVITDVDLGVGGMGSSDGATITAAEGKTLLQTFRARGYSTCGKEGDQFTVPHHSRSRAGVGVCFGEQYGVERGWCKIHFYDESEE